MEHRHRYLLDTNILVYSLDTSERVKQDRAIDIVRQVGAQPVAAVSVQSIAELSNVALRKLQPHLLVQDLEAHVSLLVRTFPVIDLTAAIVLEAIRGVSVHKFAYYDAQIWAAARLNQIPYILSEDFATGSTVDGVTFVNPMNDSFDPKTL